MAVKLITPKGSIKLTAPTGGGGGSADLTNYYTKAQVDAHIASAEERIDFKLGSYALTTDLDELASQMANIEQDVIALDDELADSYYLKSEVDAKIPDVSGFATEDYVTDQIDYYCHDFASTEYVDNIVDNIQIPDVSAFQTEAQVQALIDASLGVIENGDY